MNLGKIVVFVLLIGVFGAVEAQYDEDFSDYRPKYEGESLPVPKKETSVDENLPIEKHQNVRVDSLSDVLATFYDRDDVPANGHRIQIYTGSSEKAARSAESLVKERYGAKYVVYTKYDLQWRVRVGDFLDPLRAHRLYVELKDDFPNALKVEDIVNVKKVN